MPKAFVMVDVFPGKEASVQKALSQLPGMKFVHQVTGAHDLIALLDIDPYEQLASVVSMIRKVDGIRSTDTELVIG
ncbi:MAG: Lrp/AsnC ligand binding domain-containing protein [Candidatus Omnitrophica bacterium]|nr:Lrp/AsnC ligand binding domain-containing protein [Candidatus Omnitrophota bacterium]